MRAKDGKKKPSSQHIHDSKKIPIKGVKHSTLLLLAASLGISLALNLLYFLLG